MPEGEEAAGKRKRGKGRKNGNEAEERNGQAIESKDDRAATDGVADMADPAPEESESTDPAATLERPPHRSPEILFCWKKRRKVRRPQGPPSYPASSR